jgi:hypothetical protein
VRPLNFTVRPHVLPFRLKRFRLIIVWQTVMVAAVLYFDSPRRVWLPSLFAVSALLVPFIGYIAAIYNAPILAHWPRVARAFVLTLASALATLGGYYVLFAAGSLLMGRLGYAA